MLASTVSALGRYVMLYGIYMLIIAVLMQPLASFATQAKLDIAVGNTLPPYSIAEFESGIEVEIVRTALNNKGYSAEFFYVPFARLKSSLNSQLADAALTLKIDTADTDIFYSEPHVEFHNVVVTLAQSKIDIEAIDDLNSLSVLAFQNATLNLGEEFAKMAKDNSRYTEIANQESQVSMLFLQRVDALVIDRRIFDYYHQRMDPPLRATALTFHDIFSPTNYHVGFTEEAIRDQFNDALREMRLSGQYQKILEKY
ncbi:substrate-binding periplasmic protein [Pseudoalteromonas pernae]|uniref:substrate-binding periplasmic protein n=1 Tax=Pseudoalteromonas pernae TaxID=3118054 RepID=UPI003242C81D